MLIAVGSQDARRSRGRGATGIGQTTSLASVADSRTHLARQTRSDTTFLLWSEAATACTASCRAATFVPMMKTADLAMRPPARGPATAPASGRWELTEGAQPMFARLRAARRVVANHW